MQDIYKIVKLKNYTLVFKNNQTTLINTKVDVLVEMRVLVVLSKHIDM
jgi:hypothetical protein